jgi:thiamine kinase-like enzyme
MVFLLNQTNVFNYLTDLGYQPESNTGNIEPIVAKNFNLLITIDRDLKLLVKQERHDPAGQAAGEFRTEWQVQELVRDFPALQYWQPLISEVLHFDMDNSILVFKYLSNYQDLMDFYTKENTFPISVARQLGTVLATIHRDTYHRSAYQAAVTKNSSLSAVSIVQRFIQGLERITPEVFGNVPDDGLKFYALYQRYDSLSQALVELGETFQADCLTHNDLKLNNVLLHHNWEQPTGEMVRLIDWERSAWGDPAFDLGTLIGSYLQLWLNSLVVSRSLSIEESLGLAVTPLELVQPSILALTQAYLEAFPQILIDRPDFLERSVQLQDWR